MLLVAQQPQPHLSITFSAMHRCWPQARLHECQFSGHLPQEVVSTCGLTQAHVCRSPHPGTITSVPTMSDSTGQQHRQRRESLIARIMCYVPGVTCGINPQAQNTVLGNTPPPKGLGPHTTQQSSTRQARVAARMAKRQRGCLHCSGRTTT